MLSREWRTRRPISSGSHKTRHTKTEKHRKRHKQLSTVCCFQETKIFAGLGRKAKGQQEKQTRKRKSVNTVANVIVLHAGAFVVRRADLAASENFRRETKVVRQLCSRLFQRSRFDFVCCSTA